MSARYSLKERRYGVFPLLTSSSRITPASSKCDNFLRTSIYDRNLTPCYDFLSESDGTFSGTPDCLGEESDSSTGSVLERATAEATRALAEEWEAIERTLYDEEGPHVTRPHLLEECRQWKEMFPQLRVVGKRIPIPDKLPLCRRLPEEEILEMHYSDYEEFSESEERHSESSFSDTTPQNSPRTRIHIATEPRLHNRLSREKSAFPRTFSDGLNDSFHSMLQITPLYPRSPPLASNVGKRHYSSILKSEVSSSKWMKNCTVNSPVTRPRCDRTSAKSFLSLDIRNCSNVALSATERKKIHNEARISTAKPKNDKLQPYNYFQNVSHYKPNSSANGKVWLPPLHIEEKNKPRSLNLTQTNSKIRKSTVPRPFRLISESEY